jgi:hypothetical protein
MWIVFHASYVTRRMFKIMDFAIVALFDDFLPAAGKQLPQIPTHCGIPHGVFQGAASGWYPATGDRARGIHVCVQVERHCHPCLQECTSLLIRCPRFSEASNAPAELRPTGENPGISHQACAVGRQFQWVVRPVYGRAPSPASYTVHASTTPPSLSVNRSLPCSPLSWLSPHPTV